MTKKRWTITADKFLSQDHLTVLLEHILRERDLAVGRGNNPQAIRDFYLVHGLLESGCRVQEFCDLKNSDFAGLKLNVRCGKGNKPRTILLTRATGNLLTEWQSIKGPLGFDNSPEAALFPSRYGRHYSKRGIQDRIKIIFCAAGLPEHLATHSLRHTYASLLLATKKVSLPTVRDNLGHSSLAITNLYSHAIGNLDDVDLFLNATSPFIKKSELEAVPKPKKINDFTKRLSSKVKLK